MKQGAYLDKSEPYQPWIQLILLYVMENINRQEVEGSFQPLNMGIGWDTDVLDISKEETVSN